eukprot:3269185-Lingulodinium_polyedra.AAC.1
MSPGRKGPCLPRSVQRQGIAATTGHGIPEAVACNRGPSCKGPLPVASGRSARRPAVDLGVGTQEKARVASPQGPAAWDEWAFSSSSRGSGQ